ncbi:MAG: S16 family serine protease, partial [Anaerovoracaceae bacterium]|nr:S16 family serine protease [Anaerovoracaceae bacterium]
KNVVCGETKKVSITGKKVEEMLGKKRFRFDIIKGEKEVGVTTGLAWTVVGGDTLFIETTAVPGSGKLVLTGQMGDVMQESAKAGVSYIRSVSRKLKIDEDFYKKYDLHIHIPEGAIPKDGPSAGVTMCTAIISTLTGIPARKDIAMTGEITLRGKVLPVGGIREKVMAAHRAGIRKVLLPKDNDVDIQDIPEVVRNDMEFVLLRNVDDALKEVLVKDSGKPSKRNVKKDTANDDKKS